LERKLKQVFGRVGRKVGNPRGVLRKALEQFMTKYATRDATISVEQPINFLMQLLTYDGVYADYSDQTFSRGSVLYDLSGLDVTKEHNEQRITRF
jgi:hypothetical protein